MLLNRNPAPSPPPDTEPLHGLVRTHWSLAICVVCGHEHPRGEHNRATCPGCGAQLSVFPLYRDLQAPNDEPQVLSADPRPSRVAVATDRGPPRHEGRCTSARSVDREIAERAIRRVERLSACGRLVARVVAASGARRSGVVSYHAPRGVVSDRRLWLAEPCPTVGAGGLRCQTSRYGGKPSRVLHGARGWRHRSCPTCKAQPGELCRTPGPAGRPAAHRAAQLRAPRAVRRRGRVAGARALERLCGAGSFSGGGGSPGSVAAVTLEDADKHELARWENGEGELPEALAAPIWGRYALFRGHPRITGLVLWDAHERQVIVAGKRGGQKFDEVLSAPRRPTRLTVMPPSPPRARHVAGASRPGGRRASLAARGAGETSRLCEHCDEPSRGASPRGELLLKALPAGRLARAAQAPASKPPSPPPEKCSWCDGSMPDGLRAEAKFWSSAAGRRPRVTPSTNARTRSGCDGSAGACSSRSATGTAGCAACCATRRAHDHAPKMLAVRGTRLGLIPHPAAEPSDVGRAGRGAAGHDQRPLARAARDRRARR